MAGPRMKGTDVAKKATLHTNHGDITLNLFDEQAPKTVANFVGLAGGTQEYRDAETGQTTTGKFYGVGIEISTENNQIIVVSPIEDTPAYKAGVKAGDVGPDQRAAMRDLAQALIAAGSDPVCPTMSGLA